MRMNRQNPKSKTAKKEKQLLILKFIIAGITLLGGALLALLINVFWKNKCPYMPTVRKYIYRAATRTTTMETT
ncbi:hypothetical protein GWI33_008085 [Rhynchophorus ferrugineus]|uniref:Uncharacterized protein n=1 Tax=Rhynchophorus ferrugineus TaxID=354439 RepID=A0A834IIW5_RHYFE|nr:hypothetical protein GWI33_008085 [Rhynchophorus ferrugineus]